MLTIRDRSDNNKKGDVKMINKIDVKDINGELV
jgi:hypothetical protein